MTRLRFLLITALIWLIPLQISALAGDTSVVNVTATIPSKNQCKFNTNKAALDFGNLNPSNPVVISASTTISFVCNGSSPTASFAITDDGGLNSYKMVHETDPAQLIPYSLSMSPVSGTVPKGVDQNFTIDGSINGADYLTALIGAYSDTVTITIAP